MKPAKAALTRAEVVCLLNKWEWPTDISAFNEEDRREIIKAAFAAASEIVPWEQWGPAWQTMEGITRGVRYRGRGVRPPRRVPA